MQGTFLYREEKIGQREVFTMYGSGPSSYSAISASGTGDLITMPGDNLYIDSVIAHGFSISKNYYVRPFSSVVGTTRATWGFAWYYAKPQTGVAGLTFTAGSGQTNGTYVINGSGGSGTGAQIQVTISGGAITAVSILNAGSGYTWGTAPTFTVSAGGTPGTVTATLGSVSNGEVVNGANLSGESIQFSALGGEF